jgi:hypothetical protein
MSLDEISGLRMAEDQVSSGAARRVNFHGPYKGRAELQAFFALPQATPGFDRSWFGFLIAVKPGSYKHHGA